MTHCNHTHTHTHTHGYDTKCTKYKNFGILNAIILLHNQVNKGVYLTHSGPVTTVNAKMSVFYLFKYMKLQGTDTDLPTATYETSKTVKHNQPYKSKNMLGTLTYMDTPQ